MTKPNESSSAASRLAQPSPIIACDRFHKTSSLDLVRALNVWWMPDSCFIYTSAGNIFCNKSGIVAFFCLLIGKTHGFAMYPTGDFIGFYLSGAIFYRKTCSACMFDAIHHMNRWLKVDVLATADACSQNIHMFPVDEKGRHWCADHILPIPNSNYILMEWCVICSK